VKNLLFVVAILVAGPVFAQSQPIRVMVTAGANQESRDVADRLSGRLGISSRYALVSTGATQVLLAVSCLRNVSIDGRKLGVTCYFDLSYWPVDGVALFTALPGTIAEGDELYVTEGLFDDFVKETSDEKLAKAANTFKTFLNLAIAKFPHGVD
jgi:hypothetical protein